MYLPAPHLTPLQSEGAFPSDSPLNGPKGNRRGAVPLSDGQPAKTGVGGVEGRTSVLRFFFSSPGWTEVVTWSVSVASLFPSGILIVSTYIFVYFAFGP